MCGLAGYVGPKQDYNKMFMKYLAISQDSRGGNGCGIAYINDRQLSVLKSVRPPVGKYFKMKEPEGSNFFKEMLTTEHPIPDQCDIMIAHARLATVGDVSIEFTQPFQIDTPETSFVVAHNGTITNWAALADELFTTSVRADIKNDSQFLAHCIAYNKFDAIATKYDGAASILWYDIADPNTMYMFAGSLHVYPNETPKFARPLHFWTSPQGGTYFSSESGPLFDIKYLNTEPGNNVDEFKVYSVPVNTLCKVKGDTGDFKTLSKYSRVRDYVYTKTPALPGARQRLMFKDDETRQSVGTLVCKFGVYYLGFDIATSDLVNSDGEAVYTLSKQDDIYALPIFVTPTGKLASFNGERFEIELFPNMFSTYEGYLYELYFLNGIMFPSQGNMRKYFKDRVNMVYIDLLSASKYSVNHVFSGINAPTVSQSCYFTCKGGPSFTGVYTFPFAPNTYTFDNGSLVKITPITKLKFQKRLWASALESAGVKMLHTNDFKKDSLRISEQQASNS
jgi:hypothetical protein